MCFMIEPLYRHSHVIVWLYNCGQVWRRARIKFFFSWFLCSVSIVFIRRLDLLNLLHINFCSLGHLKCISKFGSFRLELMLEKNGIVFKRINCSLSFVRSRSVSRFLKVSVWWVKKKLKSVNQEIKIKALTHTIPLQRETAKTKIVNCFIWLKTSKSCHLRKSRVHCFLKDQSIMISRTCESEINRR